MICGFCDAHGGRGERHLPWCITPHAFQERIEAAKLAADEVAKYPKTGSGPFDYNRQFVEILAFVYMQDTKRR